MAESNGNGGVWSGMPWWVKAIALVGVPAIIALHATFVIGSDARAIRDRLNTHLNQTEGFMSKQTQQAEKTNAFLFIMCLNNAAMDEIKKERCRRASSLDIENVERIQGESIKASIPKRKPVQRTEAP